MCSRFRLTATPPFGRLRALRQNRIRARCLWRAPPVHPCSRSRAACYDPSRRNRGCCGCAPAPNPLLLRSVLPRVVARDVVAVRHGRHHCPSLHAIVVARSIRHPAPPKDLALSDRGRSVPSRAFGSDAVCSRPPRAMLSNRVQTARRECVARDAALDGCGVLANFRTVTHDACHSRGRRLPSQQSQYLAGDVTRIRRSTQRRRTPARPPPAGPDASSARRCPVLPRLRCRLVRDVERRPDRPRRNAIHANPLLDEVLRE